jgi:hypothetical protein
MKITKNKIKGKKKKVEVKEKWVQIINNHGRFDLRV